MPSLTASKQGIEEASDRKSCSSDLSHPIDRPFHTLAATGRGALFRGGRRGAIDRVVAADRVGVRTAGARNALGQELERGRGAE